MDSNKINSFMAENAGKFRPEIMPLIKGELEKLSDDKYSTIKNIGFKNPTTIFILSLVFGGIGLDRFLIGNIGLGILKLISLGGFGILAVIDWFIIGNKTRDYNYNKFLKSVAMM